MKLTKIVSIILILSLLIFGSTWTIASSTIESKWSRIGIATSQNTIDISRSTLKEANGKMKKRLCTLSPRDKINYRIQLTSTSNQFAKQQNC